MPNQKTPPSFRKKPRLGLIALAPMMAMIAMPPQFVHAAAAKPIAATAKYDKKIDKVVVAGKTAATISAGAKVTAYDAANNIILYTSNSNAKNAFSMQLLGATSVPCMVRLEVTNPKDNSQAQILLPVSGAAASCKTVPTCAITKPAMDTEITVGNSVAFEAAKAKGEHLWSISDGSADEKQTTINHSFKSTGKFDVQLTVTDGANQCSDAITVSVIPPAGTNPNSKVSEETAPALAGAMPKGASNDSDAIVVLPFEDTGMQGGSQITIPFNPLTPYNALNAQVVQKIAHKPKILDNSEVKLSYSAASNLNDPVAASSINSTSQNLFPTGKAGVNYDPATSTCDNDCLNKGTVTNLIPGQDFADASISKSEFWDRTEQKYTTDGVQRGQNIFDRHNTIVKDGTNLQSKPDEGRRGHVDLGQGVRAMPGISNPYKANVPQNFDYSSDQASFVAQNIPASSVDDQGRVNPYPLMRVEAKAGASRVAATDAVYTTSSETRCRECHDQGKIGAENVWRTPVHETELRNADGTPGPATGEGSFQRSKTPATIPADKANTLDGFKEFGYGAAIHNRFDEKHVEYNLFGQTEAFKSVTNNVTLEFDANGVRKDRVSESRWLKPDGSTSPTNPGKDPAWKLQIKLKFKSAKDYGDESDWRMQEKASLFNTELLHDYMTKYYGQNSGLKVKELTDLKNVGVADPTKKARQFGTGFATTFADGGEEKSGSLGAQCAGHHTSQVKADFGAGAQSYQGSLSNFSMTMHAFHGKMQVYKDGDKKGQLIRDDRGHPKMWGGRGWDSMYFDDNNVRLRTAGTVLVDESDVNEGTKENDASADKLKDPTLAGTKSEPRALYDTKKNNWAPEVFPMDPKGEPLYKFGDDVAMEENCAKCHTGRTEKSYRDIHHAAGLKCDSCHGDMLAVGNGYRNEKYDYNLTAGGALGKDDHNKLTVADTRRPWIDQPDCGSCHIGNGNIKQGNNVNNHLSKNVFSAGVLKQAWLDGDKSGASMLPMNVRFAVMPHKETRPEKATATDTDVTAGLAARRGDTIYAKKELSQSLYRKSSDVHGNLNCSTCHGASHAIWPNKDPNANDNKTAKQLQGYDGNIAECSVCHIKDDFKTGLVATDGGHSGLGVAQGVRDGTVVDSSSAKAFLAGPHGMHPVGDESWYKNAAVAGKGGWHNDFAKKAGPDGEDQCAACHGKDHKGTRLSKSLVDRTLTDAKGKAVKVAKGQVIGCDLCHKLDKSFIGSPQGVAKEHPAPTPGALSGAPTGGHAGH